MSNRGHITLFDGPMFAGKSSELLKEAKRHSIAKRKVLLIKYEKERYVITSSSSELFPVTVLTHDKQEVPRYIDIKACISFEDVTGDEILDEIIKNQYKVVCIDEGQFYPGLARFCNQLQLNGIQVLVSALNGTFERKPWPNVVALLPYVKYHIHFNAVCDECGEDAPYSKKITHESVDTSTGVLVGGKDKYIAVCLEHF